MKELKTIKMKKYLKNYKTTIPAILILIALVGHLLGYVTTEQITTVTSGLVFFIGLGAKDVTKNVNTGEDGN